MTAVPTACFETLTGNIDSRREIVLQDSLTYPCQIWSWRAGPFSPALLLASVQAPEVDSLPQAATKTTLEPGELSPGARNFRMAGP